MQQAYIVLHNFVYRPGGRLYQTGDMLKSVFAENDPWIKSMIKYKYLRVATKEDYSTVDNSGRNIARQRRNRLNRMHKVELEINAEENKKKNRSRSGRKNVIYHGNRSSNGSNVRSSRSRSNHFNGGLWTISGIDLSA